MGGEARARLARCIDGRSVEASARGVGMMPRAPEKQAALALAVLSFSIALLLFDLAGGLAHGAGRPLGVTLRLAGGWAMVAVVLSWITFGGGRGSSARSKALLASSALAAPLGLFAWMQLFHGTYEEPIEAAGHQCLALTLAIGLIPFASVMALHGATRRDRAGPLGAAAAATCGAWASVLVELWCPLTNAVHVLLGHVAPVALLVVCGALVAGWRAEAREP